MIIIFRGKLFPDMVLLPTVSNCFHLRLLFSIKLVVLGNQCFR